MFFSVAFTSMYTPAWSISVTGMFCARGLGSARFGAGFSGPFCLLSPRGLSQHRGGTASFLRILVHVEPRMSGT